MKYKKAFFGLLLVLSLLAPASAELTMDAITFDPAIIASGDEVDIVVQFHHEQTLIDEQRINDPRYTFSVRLEPDDELTRQYVRIDDAVGDDIRGSVLSGGVYNKRFRVKVSPQAPAGNYEFKLLGQWSEDGAPLDNTQFLRFRMPVKKEGIVLDIASYETVPADVRAADNYVEIDAFIENTGEKAAERVEVTLDLPEGVSSSYTNNNRVWIGGIRPGSRAPLTAFVDIDQDVEPGLYELRYTISYQDEDRNTYTQTRTIPFLIRTSPYLVVTDVTSSAVAGGDATLEITVRNDGTESAEGVDVRLLPESSQPFSLDVRSTFLGEIEPGEERTAYFTLAVHRDAKLGDHDLSVLIRAKGDSDEGDDNIYTFSRHATLSVDGTAVNVLLWIGVGVLAVIAIGVLARRVTRRKKR